jgi:Domain of unknown function (DUF4157)
MDAPPIVHEVLSSPGQPLTPAMRTFMEPRFGYDFSSVRLHTGSAARRSAADLGALAYTVGSQIVLRNESPSPALLAHELAHVVQQASAPPSLLQRAPAGGQDSPPPQSPGLEGRLQIIDETGAAAQSRLMEIIHTGGPIPEGTKVIGAAIIEVEGYQGPTEIRAISGSDTDALGESAPVFHATTPSERTLSATRGISAPSSRHEFPYSHINDAEIKVFEFVIPQMPKGARGTIHFMTVRVRHVKGQVVFEPYQACSGCIRGSFEAAGMLPEVDLVSHAPVHPAGTADLGKSQVGPGEQEEPVTNPQGLKPGSVNMSPRDADVDPATGKVVPGPNTDAARARRAQASAPKTAPGTGVEQGSEMEAGAIASGPETGGTAGRAGGSSGLGIEIAHVGAAGAATVRMDYLIAKLKARRDQKTAQQQIDAFLEIAKNRINANPDGAVKRMMADPYRTIYAWIHLDSSVVTSLGVDPWGYPTMSDSSPILDLGPIEYMPFPMDPSLINSFPPIRGGGPTRPFQIFIPL